MATTVLKAFEEFLSDYVNIDPDQARTARSSRDYLMEQLNHLKNRYYDFPPITGDYIPFGSFARKTKIKPLDDIDIMVILESANSYIRRISDYAYALVAVDESCPLWNFRNDGTNVINSIRILNKFKSALTSVPNYKKAEIHRRQEAVTLSLKSYDWVFDIVPAVEVYNNNAELVFYLIPDGKGNWKPTNPKIDATRITNANREHYGMLLPLIRLLKYWNKIPNKPSLRSYYFENLVINTMQGVTFDKLHEGVKKFFIYASNHLFASCPDPKGLGPNLDADVDYYTRIKIDNAMRIAAQYANLAFRYEQFGDHKNAIDMWRKIFGSNFPTYTK